MKTRLGALLMLAVVAQAGSAFACSTCFGDYRAVGAPPPPNVQHMAIAIWFLMAAVMSVLGGVGAFGFHLWKHSNLPLEPHQQLAEEDLGKYE